MIRRCELPGKEISRPVARQRALQCMRLLRERQELHTASINRSTTLFLLSSNGISEVADSVCANESIPAISPAYRDRVDIIDSSHELAPFGPRGRLSNEFV